MLALATAVCGISQPAMHAHMFTMSARVRSATIVAHADVEAIARTLFEEQKLDPAAAKELLARDVVWEDYTTRLASGATDVASMLADKPPATRPYVLERVANGQRAGGFTFHREDENSNKGLRGTVYLELNGEGQIVFVREMAEPLFKPGEAMIKFLQTVAKKDEAPPAKPEYVRRVPVGCADLCKYIWKESNGDMEEALNYMSESIIYEDFNYPKPFLGKGEVKPFLDEFTLDLGILFFAERMSEGADACCFTWRVEFAGLDTPTNGISFYATDADGKIDYIRDIPQPVGFKPLLDLATFANPQLRRFQPAP